MLRASGLKQKKTELTLDIEALQKNKKAQLYIEMADKYLDALGYTDHGQRHINIVSKTAYDVLKKLAPNNNDANLAAAAGFLHDIGNMLGRSEHHYIGALLAKEILEEVGYDLEDIARIMVAIAVHDDDKGVISDSIAAALVLADKADVHRSRVRNPSLIIKDIHDRVNYAATESQLDIDSEKKFIRLSLTIDTEISQVIEYFEIFLSRMLACKKAAKFLGCEFHLYINNIRMA